MSKVKALSSVRTTLDKFFPGGSPQLVKSGTAYLSAPCGLNQRHSLPAITAR